VARCLIIGCGCRGQQLARALRDGGHVVRGTTRRPERLADIEAAGAEPVLADPDRLATLVPALDHVSVVVVLLGSATGGPETLEALHGPRLEALLVKLLDTTIRGVVYEATGSVPEPVLGAGTATIARLCPRSRIPFELLAVSRDDPSWLGRAQGAVDGVLGPPV
jgi:threonine dehydrogenase-like Zn-dependent dehydrogenase